MDPIEVVVLRTPKIDPLDGWGDETTIDSVVRSLTVDGVKARVRTIRSRIELDEYTPEYERTLIFPNGRRINDSESLVEPLEARRLPLVGGGSVSTLAQNKVLMKEAISRSGIPTPEWILTGESLSAAQVIDLLGLPVIVKPIVGAESSGVRRYDDEKSLESAVNQPGFFIEQWRKDREFTVAVLGNGTERIVASLEVVVPGQETVLDSKIKAAGIRDLIRPVSPGTTQALIMERLAVDVCETLGIDDWARIDVLLDDSGAPFVVDVNVFPGLRHGDNHPSFYPLCFNLGYSLEYHDVIRALISTAAIRCGWDPPPSISSAYWALREHRR